MTLNEDFGTTGADENDVLGGSIGNDSISGGSGNDLIIGDSLNANPDAPLDYTVEINSLPFSATSVTVSVNGEPQSEQTAIGSDGSAEVKLDASDLSGDDINLEFTGIIPEFQYEFYDLVPNGFSARNIPTTGADYTGAVDNLNVGSLAQELTGSRDTYSVRYTSELHIETGGTYTFSTRSDDGSILYIDGEEVVNNDGLHGARTREGDIILGPGVHNIEIVFFENRGGDILDVSIAGPDTNGVTVDIIESELAGREISVTQTIPPGDVSITGLLPALQYEFFDSTPANFSVFNIPATGADYTGTVDQLDVGTLADELTGSRDTYSVRYTGELYIGEAGTYDFSSLSDDGFALLIDGEPVIVNDGLHAPSGRDGSVFLGNGLHNIEILFFENTGQDILNITFSGPDTDGQEIDFFDSPNIGHRDDVQTSEGGDDVLDGGTGDDTIEGGAGNDNITGGEGADDIDGGDGNRDTVAFIESGEAVTVDLLNGVGSGGDAEGDTYVNIEHAHGSDHNDILIGDNGTNRLVGRDGDDEIRGNGGDDYLLGGDGADILDGGDGVDTAEYDYATSGVIVDLSTGVGTGGYAEGDTLISIENLFGSRFNDVLTGDSGANRLNGSFGDDILNGGGGDDILIGGEGADQLNGGAGNRDVADYSASDEAVVVDLVNGGSAGDADGDTYTGVEFVYGSNHDDTIIGDDGNNRLIGNDGDDTLVGGAGNDYFIGGNGADHFDGGEGNRDTVEYRDADAGVIVDLVNGGSSGDADGDTFTNIEYVYGSDHDDTIIGNDAANRLIGFDGNDTIIGGGGNDYIIGMDGDDTLTGGTGADVFLFKSEFDDDTITDFEAGAGRTDRLWLDLAGIEEIADLTFTDTADGVLVGVGTYGTILLENVLSTDLHSDDFIF